MEIGHLIILTEGFLSSLFSPFGFVLNLENENRIMELSEITDFKFFETVKIKDFNIILNKYATYSPIPLDFSTKENFIK